MWSNKPSVFFWLLCFSIRAISTLYADAEWDQCAQQLVHGSRAEQLAALREIKKKGASKDFVDVHVMPLIAEKDIRVRLQAIQIAYEYGNRGVRDILGEVYKQTKRVNERLKVVETMIALQDEELMKRSVLWLEKETDDRIAMALIRVILTVQAPEDLPIVYERIQTIATTGSPEAQRACIDMFARQGKQAVPFMLRLLPEVKGAFFDSLCMLISESGDPTGRAALIQYAQGQGADRMRGYSASFALYKGGDASYLRMITDDVRSNNEEVRVKAVRFLTGKIGITDDTPFFPMIEKIAKDSTQKVVQQAAEEYVELYYQIHRRSPEASRMANPPVENTVQNSRSVRSEHSFRGQEKGNVLL